MPFAPALTGMLHGVLGKTLPAMPALGSPAEEPTAKPVKPFKLWDLPAKHHCPVIGTCLRMEDLVRFARRHAFEAALHDEFELHVEAVGLCQTRNAVSDALQKFLDRKYAASLARFAKLKSDAAVLAAWRECLSKGDIAGPLWAIYTHKATSAQARDGNASQATSRTDCQTEATSVGTGRQFARPRPAARRIHQTARSPGASRVR